MKLGVKHTAYVPRSRLDASVGASGDSIFGYGQKRSVGIWEHFAGHPRQCSRRPSKPVLETARVVVPFEDNRLLTSCSVNSTATSRSLKTDSELTRMRTAMSLF